MHHLKEVINIFIIFDYNVYFITNASNSYWTVSIKTTDRNKIDFFIFNNQWVYNRISQELKSVSHIYTQFEDLVFESLSKNSRRIIRISILLKRLKNHAFEIFIDDYAELIKNYESMFIFFHEIYFSRIVFESIYFNFRKIVVFVNNFELLRFQRNVEGLRFSIKYREKIKKWPVSTTRVELNVFFWLISFLRIFISERIVHVFEMKKIYLEFVSIDVKTKQAHDGEMKKCDQDFTKSIKKSARSKKETVRRKYIKRDIFIWTNKQ